MEVYRALVRKSKRPIIHNVRVATVKTKPFAGQLPGADGLINWVTEFEKSGYVENFVQCLLYAGLGQKRRGVTLVVGGDGRYYSDIVLQIIIRMAAANGVSKLYIGQFGVMTTPAISLAIRENKADGGIVISGSQYPGGLNRLFGIKLNLSDGGPAGESVNLKIHEMTTKITEYRTCTDFTVKLNRLGVQHINTGDKHVTEVVVFDSVKAYGKAMELMFDFWQLRALFSGSITGSPIRLLLDGRNGATGFYLLEVFREHLGVFSVDHRRFKSRDNFGGADADPRIFNSEEFLEELKEGDYDIGAAFSTDGTRALMICDDGSALSVSDALALFAHHLDFLPFHRKYASCKGFARSICTSAAIDAVAKKHGYPCYVVSSKQAYFNQLMNSGKVSVCGDEQYGITGCHVREYDAIWTVLAWLSVYARTKVEQSKSRRDLWALYGRYAFCRYDIENCSVSATESVIKSLNDKVKEKSLSGSKFLKHPHTLIISSAEAFCCFHSEVEQKPVNDAIILTFTNGSRIIFKATVYNKDEATLHLWIDCYSNDSESQALTEEQLVRPFLEVALQIANVRKHTGREKMYCVA